MVFQKYALFPHLTVSQNIAFPLKLRSKWQSRWKQWADEMLELVQMGHLADRLPYDLSGGQQQRVAVARSLAFEPPVMLMDEPLGALDKKPREAMQFEIKRMQKQVGATVLYVTYDQEEALTMSDRVAIMDAGRVVQIGTPAALYHAQSNRFVADFIGKINFLNGKILSVEHDKVLIRLSGDVVVRTTASSHVPLTTAREGDNICFAMRPERLALKSRGSQTLGASRGSRFLRPGARSTAQAPKSRGLRNRQGVSTAKPFRRPGLTVESLWPASQWAWSARSPHGISHSP